MGALPSVLIEEGAMLHVREVEEQDYPYGTGITVERLDGSLEEFVTLEPGSKHTTTVVSIGSESRRIAGNHIAVYPERLVNYPFKVLPMRMMSYSILSWVPGRRPWWPKLSIGSTLGSTSVQIT